MKLVNKFKSPNYDKRKSSNINFIIIHYTSLKNNKEAISYLCDPKKKVSCHYLISQKGEIFNLVDENNRAWHAGISYWDGVTDINSCSIGIELDFSYKNSNNKFTKKMISSLKILIKYLCKKYSIKKCDILGHSDIAPYRKIDPGYKFPWEELIKSDLVFNPVAYTSKELIIINKWFSKKKITSKNNLSKFILGYLGYDVVKAFKSRDMKNKLIKNYQTRYINDNISGVLDKKTITHLKFFLINLILTKN